MGDRKNSLRVAGRSPRINMRSLGGFMACTVLGIVVLGVVATQENQARNAEKEAEWLALEADIRSRQEEETSSNTETYAKTAMFEATMDQDSGTSEDTVSSQASKLALLASHARSTREHNRTVAKRPASARDKYEAEAEVLRRKEKSQREWSAFASSGIVQQATERQDAPRGDGASGYRAQKQPTGPEGRYLDSARTARKHKYEIHAGTMIPAVMKSGLNSDLPGRIVAQVTSRVFDSVQPEVCLIPQGARLFGKYDAGVVAGQERVLVIWDELIYPDGSKQSLLGMQGYDTAGYSGLTDKVDSHMRGILGRVMMLSLLTGSLNLAANSMSASGQPAALAYGESVQGEMQSTVSEFLRRGMNRKPTLVIRPGMRVNVMVDRHMVFDRPYGC